MVEYIDQNILTMQWQRTTNPADMTLFDYKSEYMISGSEQTVSLWRFVDNPDQYEQLPIIEETFENVDNSVSQVHLIGKLAFVALSNATVSLYELVDGDNRKCLNKISSTKNLHNNQACTGMIFSPQMNSVITCGQDGCISQFDIDKQTIKPKSTKVALESLECIDAINANEVICGTLTGSLKHFDFRSGKVVGSFSSKNQSTLCCVQRNPNVNHLAVAGNDDGYINLYDLRSQDFAVAKLSVHNSAVTCIKYQPRASDIMYSSSADGFLLRWSISPDFSSNNSPKADTLVSTGDYFSINCFDVDQQSHLIYATDQETIHYRKSDCFGH